MRKVHVAAEAKSGNRLDTDYNIGGAAFGRTETVLTGAETSFDRKDVSTCA